MNALLTSLSLAALTPAPDPAPLGTTWTLQSIQRAGGVPITPGAALAQPTLRLDTSGAGLRVSGSTGCSPLSGAGTLKGQALILRGLQGGSSMNCPDAALSLREDYLALLGRTTRFERRGDTLTLVAGGGRLVFTGGGMTAPQAQQPSLDGSYVARTLMVGGQEVPLRGLLALTVKGTVLNVTGVVGCNSLRAAGTLKGNQMQFVPLGATRLLCPAPQARAEEALAALLRGPVTAALSGSALTLTGPGGTLTLSRTSTGGATGSTSPAPAPSPMPGASAGPVMGAVYRLKQIGGEAAPASVRPVTLSFEGGRVGGNDGCNSFGAAYSLKGGRLTVSGPVTSTRMMCPEEQTLPLISLLQEGPTLSVSGAALTLRAGDQVWTFEKN